ncbi:FAD-dependent oxidoreductase [Sciscionella sediminilitoris]|uniref:FAD-dependent oxidoreductase n=1 Tax=Sciscionella sediminilitoris TaxID=1445613 RepID=UPI0004DF7146|nr:FAD-dependent oxidoreductase [Sciscionella sp. SE31]
MERTEVCVVGGGPAGMMLGLLLARAGVEVTVLEKHADFLRDFRGDTVHPSTLRLLDELGLWAKFEQLPHSKVDSVSVPVNGTPVKVGDLSRLRTPHPYIAMVPQWDLLDLLAEAASKEPNFTLRMNTECTGLLRAGNTVTGVRYHGPDGEGALRARLTVGTDGRWSAVRAAAGLRPHEFPVSFDAWWFRLDAPENMPAALTPAAGDSQFAVLIPREGYLQVAYIAPKGIDEQLRADGIEAFRGRLRELLPDYTPQIDRLASMDEVKHLDVRLSRLRRWHRDGLLCIGDAAHAMSPIGGVGINLAVQDAVATARLLAEPLLRGTLRERDLAAVQRRRWLPMTVVQGLQRLLHRVVFDEDGTSGPPEAMLRVLRRFPALSAIPAYLIGIGPLPEHAPRFARRR